MVTAEEMGRLRADAHDVLDAIVSLGGGSPESARDEAVDALVQFGFDVLKMARASS